MILARPKDLPSKEDLPSRIVLVRAPFRGGFG